MVANEGAAKPSSRPRLPRRASCETLSRTAREDAAAQHERLARRPRAQPVGSARCCVSSSCSRSRSLAAASTHGAARASAATSSADGSPARVWRQYLLRVSQLALARIVLYRSWEDVGSSTATSTTAASSWYERLDGDLEARARRGIPAGRERYHWLFGSDNNYDWFRPRDEALVDVLYALVPFPLGSSAPTCSAACTSPTLTRSTVTGSASSTHHVRSSVSCSTVRVLGPTACSASRATSAASERSSTSPPARVDSSSRPPGV